MMRMLLLFPLSFKTRRVELLPGGGAGNNPCACTSTHIQFEGLEQLIWH